MNRRSFLSSLIGLLVAPKVAPKPRIIVYTDPNLGKDALLGYKAGEFFKSGFVYAPYINLL